MKIRKNGQYLGSAIKSDGHEPPVFIEVAHDAAIRADNGKENDGYHNIGNEMRHDHSRLEDARQLLAAHLVDGQGQGHGKHHVRDQKYAVVQERVFHREPEGGIAEHEFKILERNPIAAKYAAPRDKVLERKHQTAHGQIIKADKAGDAGKRHKQQRNIAG